MWRLQGMAELWRTFKEVNFVQGRRARCTSLSAGERRACIISCHFFGHYHSPDIRKSAHEAQTVSLQGKDYVAFVSGSHSTLINGPSSTLGNGNR
jgi:hypothetical protein